MNYYVDYKSGKNSFKGTEPTRPLRTMSKAINKCVPKDDIIIGLANIRRPIIVDNDFKQFEVIGPIR
jgi:hypothetical protein